MPDATPQIITTIKPWIEILYLLSGCGVFILAGFGLRQLTLAKRQLETTKEIFRTQSKRASFESAIDQCNEYSRHIIQLDHKITKFAKSHSITLFNDAKIEETEKGFKVNIANVNKDHVDKFDEIEDTLSSFINGVEGFALYILAGIADENIAFSTVGNMYLRHAEMIAKITSFTNSTQEDYAHIWRLYFKWKKRSERQKLESEKKKIDEKIKKNNVEPIRAIGV